MSDPPSAPSAPPAAPSAADAVDAASTDSTGEPKSESGSAADATANPVSASSSPSSPEEGVTEALTTPPARSKRAAKASSAEEAASAGGGYRVTLPEFEGPLDLLLHLIEEHELDVRDIPIAFVAQKYVEYITLMEELNIDVASEYLVMAATLAYIKSRTLLPAAPAEETDDEEIELDPRAELIRRLLEYQKYKHVAERLAEKDLLGRDVFPRGMKAPDVEGPAPLAGMSLFKLLDAFQSVLSRATLKVDHQIDFERFSISDRINEISDILRNRPRLSFDDLFEGQRTRAELIVTFLALLEMTRLRLIRLYQEGPLEIIYIELAVSEEDKGEASDELNRPSGAALDPEEPAAPEDDGPEASTLPAPADDAFEQETFGEENDTDRFDADVWPEGDAGFEVEPEGLGELDPQRAPGLEADPDQPEAEDEAPEREPQ